MSFITEMKKLVDNGVSLSVPFKKQAKEWYTDYGVSLHRTTDESFYAISAYPDVGYITEDFDKAYEYFQLHVDPKINPGVAYTKAMSEIKNPDRMTDDEIVKATLRIIKKKGWALKYTKQVPPEDAKCQQSWS